MRQFFSSNHDSRKINVSKYVHALPYYNTAHVLTVPSNNKKKVSSAFNPGDNLTTIHGVLVTGS